MTPTSYSHPSLRLVFPEVLAQALALIAPAVTVSTNILLVFPVAGNATWLMYLIATGAMFCIALSIGHFGRRIVSTGGIYTYVLNTMGPAAGFVCGWSLVLCYILIAAAVTAGFTDYVQGLLEGLAQIQVPSLLLYCICLGLAWVYATAEMTRSAFVFLLLQGLALLILMFAGIVLLFRYGLDVQQITLKDLSLQNFGGLAIAIYSFVGFESVTFLGRETSHPKAVIPKAVLGSIVITGFFFVFLAYTEVSGLHNTPGSEHISSPLRVLSTISGILFLDTILACVVAYSFLCCAIASINSVGRLLFSLAQDGLFLSRFGVYNNNQIPYNAVSLAVAITTAISVACVLLHLSNEDSYAYLSTIATYGFLLAYLMISIAAMMSLARRQKLSPLQFGLIVLPSLILFLPVISSFYPTIPPYPYNLFPAFFILFVSFTVAVFWQFKKHNPNIIRQIERSIEPAEKEVNS